jgi:hypothetical protein
VFWDRIEAEWSEMACRVSGSKALPTTGVTMLAGDAPTDTGTEDAAAASPVVLNRIEVPDRIVA